MAFLTGIAASVLEWLLSKLLSIVGEEITTITQEQSIEDKAKADQAAAASAKTPDEISTASAGIAGDTFKQ